MENKEKLIKKISISNKIKPSQISATLDLLADGGTVPFIARYRKEITGSLDEDQIRIIQKEYEYGKNLADRKEAVLRLINEKGMLTPEIEAEINNASKMVEVEDVYRPFKEKKKTKATQAIKLGLEPLANIMLSFKKSRRTRLEIASDFVTELVKSPEEAIEQAKFIVAERVSDEPIYRKAIRNNLYNYGKISTKKKRNAVDERKVYESFYEYEEPVKYVKSHRVLAINRAEKEKVLSVSIKSDDKTNLDYLEWNVITRNDGVFVDDVKLAIADGYKRLIYPAVEREIRADLSEKAEDGANKIFSMNLKKLLLQAPIKDKTILGVDPAFRTGCKLAVVNGTGKVLEIGVIYPNERSKGSRVKPADLMTSENKVLKLVAKYNCDIIAIGNGTASRETEKFISDLIKKNKLNVHYVIVSEAGASVYSAGKVAQEEFPDYEVQERSAVSIARRVQDPLAELVKIDPKSIGVGQYQHDVTESKLNESLDGVIIDSVNAVGVDVNTASISLLTHVAGLNKTIAKNIVLYRNENGEFKKRRELLKVSRLGAKAYEQAIGFLRINNGTEPLDMTAIHPESYKAAREIMKKLNIKKNELGSSDTAVLAKNANQIEISKELEIDRYTVVDILDSLASPTRDPRDSYSQPQLRSDILHIEDLNKGEELEGTVRNVVDFGAFVDIGLKNDGLVHISKMSLRRIKHPSDILSVGQIVKVYIYDVDVSKKRVQLSLIDPKLLLDK